MRRESEPVMILIPAVLSPQSAEFRKTFPDLFWNTCLSTGLVEKGLRCGNSHYTNEPLSGVDFRTVPELVFRRVDSFQQLIKELLFVVLVQCGFDFQCDHEINTGLGLGMANIVRTWWDFKMG